MCDSTSSALVTTIPQVYGTLLSDSAWTLNMRFRSFIWPDNLPHNLICKCSREITTTHLLNCKHFITFRSKVHDAVRDQLYCMCKSHRIESFLEPLLSNLFDAENDFHKNNRGDVILPGLDGSFILLDVMSVDPCNASNERLVNSEIHNPLSNAENFKFKKYNEPLSKLASLQHAKIQFVSICIFPFGSLAPTALRFLDDFEMIVKRRTGRNFHRLFWQNRIVFSIFKGMLKMVSDALLSLGSHYERVASSGKAAGPSGISFDLLKIACSSAPEISDDLAHYFQQLIVLKINPPFELLAARLIALVKPGNGIKPDGIRPIAVGESLSRLLASIVFDRVKDKASTFLNPHQFGIKTIDGASVAAIASDTFFNAEENNLIFNLDFKNAFNSVKREAIFEVIKSDFPELSKSDLIFNSFGLKSSSGVKQGDPLGPLLFCLAIHKTLNIIKQKYPSIKIVAYMDDISLIGSFDLLELVAQEIADSYENIGLHLNASKCLLIGSSAQDLVINDSIVPFTNYSSDAFKFLGCWLGNVPQIQNELQVILEKMKIELDSISSLDIEKHIKFFMLKICYTGRITHILRSCAPSIALDFCRSFNSLRTEFFADLLDVEPGMLKSHLFSSANLGGIGFTKSSILCQSAFLGGGKNFIYEFSRRFPDDSHLLVPNCSPYLYELSCELEKLPPQIWTKCFPQSIQEIPNRSLFNLQFCCKKLQQKLSKIFESLDFDVRLGLAKKKNPAFANLFTRYV
ncbi:hypothetical protein P9112_010241 [Eukaryota sp. TZLM1-RC]